MPVVQRMHGLEIAEIYAAEYVDDRTYGEIFGRDLREIYDGVLSWELWDPRNPAVKIRVRCKPNWRERTRG